MIYNDVLSELFRRNLIENPLRIVYYRSREERYEIAPADGIKSIRLVEEGKMLEITHKYSILPLGSSTSTLLNYLEYSREEDVLIMYSIAPSLEIIENQN